MKIVGVKIAGVLGGALMLAGAIALPAAADPVVDAFYDRCVSENSYQMGPGELEQACSCMAPVLVSFLSIAARQQVAEAIKTGKPITFSGSPFKGDPADLARRAIQECPTVGAAMYQQKCVGGNEATPQCREMKEMIDQAR
ncbi:MAG TPA: hypothetical protein VGQ35_16820 [Dongiaceae bacterium]|nr:hypothetical protein [Dongiaceae bacterium]